MEEVVHESLSVRQIKVVDDAGKVRATFGTEKDQAGLVIYDRDGNTRLEISDDDKQCCVIFYGKEKPRIMISLVKNTEGTVPGVEEMPYVVIEGEFDRTQLQMISQALGPALYMIGNDGHTMAAIRGASINMPTIAVCDGRGVERAMMTETIGRSYIGLADEDGIVDTELSRDYGLTLPEAEE